MMTIARAARDGDSGRSGLPGVLACGILLLLACGPAEEPTTPKDPLEPAAGEPAADTAASELAPGATAEGVLAPGERRAYRLRLEAGDYVELEVEQQGVDLALRLLDPRRRPLLESDLPIDDLGKERLLAVVDEAGGYWMEVEASKRETAAGSYRASFRTRRPADAKDRLKSEAMEIFCEAWQHYANGAYGPALERYAAALERWQRAGDALWRAETLARMGDAYYQQRDWRQAADAHQQAMDLYRDLGETRLEALSSSTLAAAWFGLDELDRAARQHQRTLELERQLQDSRGEAITLSSLAAVYRIQGETQKALDHFSAALRLLNHPTDRLYRAETLHRLGSLYHLVGVHELARDHLREAEEIYTALGERRLQAHALSRIGQLALQLGDAEQALADLGRALELHRQVEDLIGQAVDLRRIGSLKRAAGRPEEALSHYLEALELLSEKESPRQQAAVLADLGALYGELGRNDEALASHLEALSLFDKAGNPVGQAGSLLGVAVAERRLGRLEAARQAVEKALAIAEDLRVKPFSEDLRLSFFATAQRFFEFYVDLLMELHVRDPDAGHAAAALQLSERSRARSLLDQLGEATAEIRSDAAPELLAEEQTLQARLNAIVSPGAAARTSPAAVREIVGRLDTVRAEILRQSPRYDALTHPRPLRLEQIQSQVLDPETLLLEYDLGPERSFLWLVGDRTFEAFELAAGEEIERSVRVLYDLLSRPANPESEVAARELLCELSAELLRPAAGRLGRQRLAIVADGALQYLPFAALPDPDVPECAAAPPLIVQHEIVSLPSASTLAVLRRDAAAQPAPAGTVAVLADPVFAADDERVAATGRVATTGRVAGPPGFVPRGAGPRTYRRLPHSRREAEAILRLVSAEQSYQALGFDASKATVVSGRLAGYRIVHFGTHGVVDPQQPDLSGIVLSLIDRRGKPVDGLLRAHEIYNLRLPVELVVLSACETALGKDVAGEGLVGLARGFMYAGTSRIVASLWQVGDRGTAELMAAFYRGLLEQELEPIAALRAAQLAVREKTPDPYQWAGFGLQGEWRPGG